ncbi:hypothetical protein ABG775_11100 [Peribacillus simplex]|uniref:hypothetical protein n=1 Tax=Peribacillus simplex TaxID=1478 RepID=UPI00339A2ADD
MNNKEADQYKIKKIALDRAGLRAFMGNPEDLELSFYGVFIACIPILIFVGVVWYNW